ncbi:MAG: orotidine-5'-phosphate decarboxylase [Spirochaetia bacterium]|nr:orotidine-5'-phosphate decarboxylase [Spirochaetia bacterium]
MFNPIHMNMMKNPRNDFLIVALDFDNIQKVNELIDLIPEVNFYKVGMELFYSTGPEIIKIIKNQGKKIFLDLKINDIPKTIEKTVRKLASYDVDYLTIFCNQEGIIAAREGAGASNTKILNVTVLTSQEASSSDVIVRAKMSFSAGADGIICSGRETKEIRKEIQNNEFIIVNPGIRLISGNDDQIRTVTPAEAKQYGATNIVVGRPITQSIEPKMAVLNILKSCGLE